MPLAVLMPVAVTLYLVKNCLIVLTALFPIVNPLGTSPIFLRLTPGYTPEERHILSRKVAVNSYILLLASMLIGSHILTFFGISLPVVQVGGGLIVVANGWMLLQQREEPSQAQPNKKVTCDEITSSAFYPLTLPLTVGPGSISVAITLGANEGLHFDSLTRLFAAVIWHCAGGDHGISKLSFRGKFGAPFRRVGDERHRSSIVVYSGLHRRADCLERRKGPCVQPS